MAAAVAHEEKAQEERRELEYALDKVKEEVVSEASDKDRLALDQLEQRYKAATMQLDELRQDHAALRQDYAVRGVDASAVRTSV